MPEASKPGCDRARRLSASPLLIVGAPRSGTTWLQRMLLGDPRCCGGQETHFFVSFGRVLRDLDHKASFERPHGLACYWTRDDLLDEIRRLWTRTVTRLIDEHPTAELLVEKTPDHARWLVEIDQILPSSRIVHLVRDSRAVCASLIAASRRRWGGSWAAPTARGAARTWIDHVEAAERHGARLGADRYLRVHYEDVHADAVDVLRDVLRFAGLAPPPDETLVEMARRETLTEQKASGGTPFRMTGELEGESPPEPEGFLRTGSVDAWRGELGPLQRWLVWRRTGATMQRLGYDRNGRSTR